jgi:hypothetical protein
VRLNRRELGTGLLWSRLLPASLVLVAAGVALLSLSYRPGNTVTETSASLAPLAKQPAASVPAAASVSLGHLSLMFEPNRGQTDPSVQFIARGSGYGLFLTAEEAVLSLGNRHAANSVVRMKLAGANSKPEIEGREPLPGKSNYYIGNDPSKWRVGIPQYGRVRYSQVYPGVDLVYYGTQGELEYDFEIAAGADPRQVQLCFEGSRDLRLDSDDLKITTDAGEVRLEAPRVYQEIDGTRRPVPGKFALLAENRVGFELGDYDRSRPLVIDPMLSYSTYLGGTGVEFQPSIAVDSAPDMYLTGATTSTDFPVTDGSTYVSGATSNVFVAKLDPTGTTRVFATYLGGSGADTSAGIAADAAGNAYLAGTTTSTNFPNKNAFQTAPVSPGNPHAFVTELSTTGTLLYSTYLSGNQTDTVKGMTLDNKGLVYVIGITNSTNFPLAPAAGTFQSTLQGANAFFISKVAPASSGVNSLVFSTYFGGGNPLTGTVSGGAIAVDNNANGSNIYFTGGTTYLYTGQNSQTDFPIKNAFQFCLGNPTSTSTTACSTTVTEPDAFVAKLNPGTNTGAELLYCTYLGGSHTDIGLGIGLDASGNAYVTGSTNSGDHPAVSGTIAPYQANLADPVGTATDAFVAKINNPATGTGSTNVQLTYFTYLGGLGNDSGNAIAVDNVQGARVVGTTAAANFPVIASNAVQGTFGGIQDAFVARLDTTAGGTGSASQFVTYLGGSDIDTGTGIAIDSDSNTYVTGETKSGNFPTASPLQAKLRGTQDIFAARLGPSLNFALTVVSPSGNAVNAGNQISFSYTIKNNGDTTSNVLFIDNLAGGSGSAPVTFGSASAAGGSCSSTPTDNKILCNLGTINGGQSSTVTINLTPTGAGNIANSGKVSVGAFSTTAVATPVTVNSYKLSITGNSSFTVVAGNPATYAVQINPVPVYTASISINCNAGLPGGGTTCKPSTTPVTLQNSSPSTVTVVISTIARVSTTASTRPIRTLFLAMGLPLAGFALLGAGVRRRGRRWLGGLAVLVVGTLIFLQPGCSGHSSSSTTTGTPAGTYTVNVVATSGSFSQTIPITLVVQ